MMYTEKRGPGRPPANKTADATPQYERNAMSKDNLGSLVDAPVKTQEATKKAVARPTMSLDQWKDFSYTNDAEETFAYNVDPSLIPDGFSVEWKRVEIYGKPDQKNITISESKGWRPYPADLYESLGGKLAVRPTGNAIEDGHGMQLMIRPMEYTKRAEAENYARATGKVKDFDKLALAGLSQHKDIDGKVHAYKRTYEKSNAVAVPD